MSFLGMFNHKDEKPGTGQSAKKTDSFNYEIASDIATSSTDSDESIKSALKTKYDINEDTIFPS
ncbi:hypothetical protein [Sporomusa malonica]|uniref:Uncharacterized protein n=1 Tax=Sporomusa malonica TaxID=112901 RepID=A0A1W2A4E9_9FIRM|nr:hypothetical protein [Sporomusa malonica]SMC55530.1 hypothetical protein SAMN04488500_1058 [Sporomusa malonica]